MSAVERIPHVEDGMRIGLFGGSFDPPHEGHLNASLLALKRARLDRIWWMVASANPLKDASGLESASKRAELCKEIVRGHPKIEVCAFEGRLGAKYAWQSVEGLKRARPRARFAWIIGADNLASLHKWRRWRRIAKAMPILVIDRPGARFSCVSAPAAQAMAAHRVDETDACLLASLRPPAWAFLRGPLSSVSSTELRRSR